MKHHAYYIEGSQSDFSSFQAELNPFYARQYEKFGIDEARELVQLASLKSIGESMFFLGIASITSEAQQALLKLFEEPQVGVVFILLVPHGILLSTLRSRMMSYAGSENILRSVVTRSKSKEDHSRFLRLPAKGRSEIITQMLKDDEGTKERVRDFLNALEAELAKKIKDPKTREGLQDIAKVRSYIADRSPSLKMLLEHLAICLPTL